MTRGPAQLLAYGLPGMPLAVLGLPLYVYLPTFYTQGLGMDIALVGAVLFAARAVDVVTDPLVGSISDRASLWPGRRKLPMLAGLLVLVLGVEFLFRPLADAGTAYLLTWALVTYFGWTLVIVPYTAWGAEITDDHHRRSAVSGVREAMVIAGTLLAVAIPGGLGIAEDPAATLDLLAAVLWWLLPVAVLICVAAVPDRSAARAPVPWRAGVAALRANRPFARLLAAYVLNGIANGLPATLFLLFVAHVLDDPGSVGVLLATYFLAGVGGLPLWLMISRRIGKHRAWAYSMLLACAAFLAVPFLGKGDVEVFFLVCVLSGLGLGADMALSASIQADVVDVDRAHGGGGRTGLYFGLWGMATKLALAAAVGIAFPLLDLAGFAPEGANDPAALLALSLLYGGLPIAIKLAAVALVWSFPLNAASHRALLCAMQHEDPHHDTTISLGIGRRGGGKRMYQHEA